MEGIHFIPRARTVGDRRVVAGAGDSATCTGSIAAERFADHRPASCQVRWSGWLAALVLQQALGLLCDLRHVCI